jgi:hypothetical protein
MVVSRPYVQRDLWLRLKPVLTSRELRKRAILTLQQRLCCAETFLVFFLHSQGICCGQVTVKAPIGKAAAATAAVAAAGEPPLLLQS